MDSMTWLGTAIVAIPIILIIGTVIARGKKLLD
jgi:hypothetical protein